MTREIIAGIDRARLDAFAAREAQRFAATRPKAKAALDKGAAHYLDGVPMHWMTDWPMPHPAAGGQGQGRADRPISTAIEIDDFCLGDTGSMFGHSPAPVARAIRAQAGRGLTYMLPTEDALEAGRLLTERFGAFRWQIATTATDANRFALRVARAVTGRPKVLVFNGCYHGTVDETMVTLHDGRTVNRPGLVGQVADLTQSAVCVEFNDLAGGRGGADDRRRCRRDPDRTGDDQFLHGAARARLSRRAARADPPLWRAADDRRDAHDLVRPWRLYPRAWAGPRHVRGRQMRGGRHAHRGLGHDAPRWPTALPPINATRALGPFRHGHHAVGQPDAVRRLRATLAEVMTARQLRAIWRQVPRGWRTGLPRAIAATRRALACGARRRAGRIHLRPRPAEERRRGRGRPSARRSRPPCTPAF